MWYRMMAIAFFANGLGAFGARVLQGMGLAETHSFLYLAFWYVAGLTFAMAAFLSSQRSKLGRSEIVVGGLMGLFSSVGWIFLTQAIACGMPGYLAFPIAIGGNLSIVAMVGVLVFKERLSLYGYLGILTGVAGIGLLAAA
jgi:multidrug transporter EmrE-like cation transporter